MAFKANYRIMGILFFVVLLINSMSGGTANKEISIPLPEHPRPIFMRDAWLNLNGQWDFALDRDETGEKDLIDERNRPLSKLVDRYPELKDF